MRENELNDHQADGDYHRAVQLFEQKENNFQAETTRALKITT